MEIEKQYKELLELRIELNNKLKEHDFSRIKELILWLAHSGSFQKLKQKDTQLLALDCFCSIWIEEKKKLEPMGIEKDIFLHVNSLDDIERKYLLIKYYALRIENNVPDVYKDELLQWIKENEISGIAIGKIVFFETLDREENILNISKHLKENNLTVTAMELLQYGMETYKGNRLLILEMAECWMEGKQWKQAYNCLCNIKSPTNEDKKMIDELKKVI